MKKLGFTCAFTVALLVVLAGCAGAGVSAGAGDSASSAVSSSSAAMSVSDLPAGSSDGASAGGASASSSTSSNAASAAAKVEAARAKLRLTEDYRESLHHGEKPAAFQKYIVLHDTEGEGDATGVIDYWEGAGRFVAAHFIVNKDGSIVQCVRLDEIAHHAGYGDTGHNELYGIAEDGRDDMRGATPIGDWASDYGMNAWSVGIELMHVGGAGDYPPEQLAALDDLIAYIDAYYGFESQIIDHKAWRSGNSDTSAEFAGYLANYQDHRRHV